MKRISDILRNESLDSAYDAISEARSQRRLLTGEDMQSILSYQLRTGQKGIMCGPMWLLSSYGPDCKELDEIAANLIEKYKDASEEKIMEYALPQALTFRLRRLGIVEQNSVLENIFRLDSLRLRFSAAEHLVNSSREEEGLRKMIELIPHLDYDHAIADAIPMYFSEYCTEDLKKKLQKEAIQALHHGDEATALDIRWAASLDGDLRR